MRPGWFMIDVMSEFVAVVWEWRDSIPFVIAYVSNEDSAGKLASYLVHGPEEKYMVYVTWKGITYKHK